MQHEQHKQDARTRSQPVEERADIIIVGSGAAGLTAARAAADHGADVLLLTAGSLRSGSSPRAQGGIAAAIGADDGPALHAADTLSVGGGLNDAGAVRVLVQAGVGAARALVADGMPFDGGGERPELGLEAGHQRHRILHAGGGATGLALVTTLLAHVVEHPRVRVRCHAPAKALLFEHGRVVGVASGERRATARAVVLATGGYAALWGRTTNAPESRGVGLALAYRVGAELADLEFVQFHPTALLLPGRPAFLLSEALRGEGALLVAGNGQPVVDPLLPRDRVARALAQYRAEHGPVYLSLRHLDQAAMRQRFPNLAAQLDDWGLDLARDLLPVAPAAHYCMGGIRTDPFGRTSVPGLYAAGEAACTGVQGANRLASNSLLECLVFGRRAAEAALTDPPGRAAELPTTELPDGALGYDLKAFNSQRKQTRSRTEGEAALDGDRLAARLDDDLGITRDHAGLRRLIGDLPDPDDSAPTGALVAALAARAALLRRESRGAHFRSDAPATDDRWRGRLVWTRGLGPRFTAIAP